MPWGMVWERTAGGVVRTTRSNCSMALRAGANSHEKRRGMHCWGVTQWSQCNRSVSAGPWSRYECTRRRRLQNFYRVRRQKIT